MSGLLDRLLAKKMVAPSGCWEWLGALNEDGYGRINFEGKNRHAHILMWVALFGPTNGFCVLHRCDNRCCINPDHLFLGTQIENINDMMTKRRNRHPRGEASGRAKLKETDIREIRSSGEKSAVLARQYEVSAPLISAIKKRKIWTHIND